MPQRPLINLSEPCSQFNILHNHGSPHEVAKVGARPPLPCGEIFFGFAPPPHENYCGRIKTETFVQLNYTDVHLCMKMQNISYIEYFNVHPIYCKKRR